MININNRVVANVASRQTLALNSTKPHAASYHGIALRLLLQQRRNRATFLATSFFFSRFHIVTASHYQPLSVQETHPAKGSTRVNVCTMNCEYQITEPQNQTTSSHLIVCCVLAFATTNECLCVCVWLYVCWSVWSRPGPGCTTTPGGLGVEKHNKGVSKNYYYVCLEGSSSFFRVGFCTDATHNAANGPLLPTNSPGGSCVLVCVHVTASTSRDKCFAPKKHRLTS